MRPHVIWAVVRKEVAAGWASPRFQVSGWLIVLLSVVVSLAAADEYASRRNLWKRLQEESEKSLQEAQTWSGLSPLLLRPPEPLALFAQGFDSRLGREVAISTFSVPRQLSGDYRGNDFALHRNDLDLTTVVGVLLGFSALLLAFDAFTQERERRTGKLLAAAGVAPLELFVGKYLGLGVLLNLPLGLAAASSLALFARRHLLPLDASTLARLGGLVATYEIYLSLLVLLGVTVSLVSADSSRALSRLLFVWLVIFLAVPYVALNFGRESVAQRRLEREIERQVAAWEDGDLKALERDVKQEPLLAASSGYDSIFQIPDPEDRHVRFVRYGTASFYEATARVVAREIERGRHTAKRAFDAREGVAVRRRARERLAKGASLLSPSYVLDRIAESWAGTAAEDHDRFLGACRSFREQFLGHMDEKEVVRSWRWFTDDTRETLRPWPDFLDLTPADITPENRDAAIQLLYSPPASTRMEEHMERAGRDEARRVPVADLPRFDYTRPAAGEAARRSLPELGWLLALHLGLSAAALGWMRPARDVFGARA